VDTLDWRVIGYGAWAVGSVIVWGKVFTDDFGDFRESRKLTRRERRARSATQILLSDFALLLVALSSALSILVFVTGQKVPGLQGFAVAVSLGMFFGAGLVKASFRGRKQ